MKTGRKPLLAIVVPCFNEAEAIPQTHAELRRVLSECIVRGLASEKSFILYVDDGSTDATWSCIRRLSGETENTAGIKLAANTGHQNALVAGLEHAAPDCDAAITIDADLQDDPEVIAEMLEKYSRGAEIVYGVRRSRKGEGWFKRTSARGFYRIRRALGVRTVADHADFRLLSSAALRELSRFDERNLFLRGIIPMLGLRQEYVYYDRQPRCAGTTKYPLGKMINFAADGITSFSVRPVRLIFSLGLVFLLISLAIFIYALIRYFKGETIEGWTSIILSIWLCTGLVLMSLGVIGEYLGKVYMEVKKRPRYLVEKRIGLPTDSRKQHTENEALCENIVNQFSNRRQETDEISARKN